MFVSLSGRSFVYKLRGKGGMGKLKQQRYQKETGANMGDDFKWLVFRCQNCVCVCVCVCHARFSCCSNLRVGVRFKARRGTING